VSAPLTVPVATGSTSVADVTRRPGVRAVYVVEVRKLLAQSMVRAVFLLLVVAPFAFAGGLSLQDTVPADTLFGRWSLTSGFAIPLLVLGFAGAWAIPLLTALIGGAVFAAEDGLGTWPTLLTRSVSRSAVFAGKTLAALSWALLVMVVLAVMSLLAGVLMVGRSPLVGLDGAPLSAGRASWLALAAWGIDLLPALAFSAMAVFFSVLSRRVTVGIGAPVVIGLLMQLSSLVAGLGGVRFLLLSSAFDAWHGFIRRDPYGGPAWSGALISLAYTVVLLAVARELFLRRDVSGDRR